MCLSSASTTLADHSPRFPLPFFVDQSNPLRTLTINGLSLNVVQGFPSFDNGIERVKGSVQFGQKNAFFLGMKLWEGASVYANPEMFFGYNPSNDIGVASSVNIASARVESRSPYLQLQRLFLRQVINLDGERSQGQNNRGGRSAALEDLVNTLDAEKSKNNVIITLGKFGVGDIFDDNIYAHDPTKRFMNLSFVGMNSIDWVGNSWGTSFGGSVEWNHNWWSVRGGLFQGSQLPPSNNLEPIPLKQYMAIGELEARHELFFGQTGSVKLIGYQVHGYLNQLGDANQVVEDLGGLPLMAQMKLQRNTKSGLAINVQQQIIDGIGFFMRAGIDNKVFAIDDISHAINGGFVFDGKMWNRPLDEFGIAAGANSQFSSSRFSNKQVALLGAGTNNFAPELQFETYYRFTPQKNFEFTLDYQVIKNGNFIKDKELAHVFAIRLRANF